jgi:hypothetical protein
MKSVKNRLMAAALCAIVLFSCRKEYLPENEALSSTQSSATLQNPVHGKWKEASLKIAAANASIYKTDEYYKDRFRKAGEAVAPGECSATHFDKVVSGYLSEFGSFESEMYPEYATVNQLSAIFDRSTQYFGANGEYTKLVTKQQRKLESFWNMPAQVRINGQHNSTMNDRDKIASVYITFSNATPEAAYEVADQLIAINNESTVFIETPLISFDAFATTSKLIVLGDGLIHALKQAGVDDDIAVEGVISHEWGHQVQFINSKKWYGFTADERPQTAEVTRQMELEADFFSAYFLTHKHGGTYNWKKVAEFSELFFNIGDCDFTNTGHHGTPRQRLAAAALGYITALQTTPKGHILTPSQLHEIFMKRLKSLVAP